MIARLVIYIRSLSVFSYFAHARVNYEKRGAKEFFYLYDSDGTLAAIEYNDGAETATYYPAVNSRGDVEALYNAAGVLQARYLYDSWGKVISEVVKLFCNANWD